MKTEANTNTTGFGEPLQALGPQTRPPGRPGSGSPRAQASEPARSRGSGQGRARAGSAKAAAEVKTFGGDCWRHPSLLLEVHVWGPPSGKGRAAWVQIQACPVPPQRWSGRGAPFGLHPRAVRAGAGLWAGAGRRPACSAWEPFRGRTPRALGRGHAPIWSVRRNVVVVIGAGVLRGPGLCHFAGDRAGLPLGCVARGSQQQGGGGGGGWRVAGGPAGGSRGPRGGGRGAPRDPGAIVLF